MKSYYKAHDGWWIDKRNRWYFRSYYDNYLREFWIIPTVMYRSSSTDGEHDNWWQLHFKWLFFGFGITVQFGKQGEHHTRRKPRWLNIFWG